ncbi:hypothetical protein N7492_005320 [Penicillium capsulatum]|uniref:Uncharacterized protein n=1 Tax=Penicillium capsulatum TaxID=69766 RepID=A0A9W9IFJ9_9EURO|nr:hypothetical protein N7492_005320 [Penicillium capsulatum]KAJ6135577.1 hypothetical protein N7512_000737 [Penicillium capsulatum]
MAETHQADQSYDFDVDALPLQITVHNATVVLSSFLLATILAYLVSQLYRLRVHLPPLPRPLRSLLWVIFAEPRLASLPPIVSQTLRFMFFSAMTYLITWHLTTPNAPAKPSGRVVGGRATLTMSDGSTSTVTLSDAHAFSTFLASSLMDFATVRWTIKTQSQSSSATPTLSDAIDT